MACHACSACYPSCLLASWHNIRCQGVQANQIAVEEGGALIPS